jgi:hypothetical protein
MLGCRNSAFVKHPIILLPLPNFWPGFPPFIAWLFDYSSYLALRLFLLACLCDYSCVRAFATIPACLCDYYAACLCDYYAACLCDYSCLSVRLFLPVLTTLLACLFFRRFFSGNAPFRACVCAFSCVPLHLILPAFAPFRACLCAFSCLPLRLIVSAFAPILAYL